MTLRKLRHRLADESGIALIMALGIMLVLSISVVAMIEFTSSNSRSASFSQANERAYSVAEAGLNEALSRLSTDPTNSSVLPTSQATATTTTISDGQASGTASYYGVLNGGTWTVYSSGSVSNPTGGSAVTRSVSTQLYASVTTTSSTNDDIWKYVFTDAPGCTTLSHNSNATVWNSPLYVRGNLCLTNNIDLRGSPVQVGGTLTLSGAASVGASGAGNSVAATILGGCTGGVPNPHTCTTADRVWTSTGASSLSPALVKPTFDAAAMRLWYHNADLGPARTCNNTGGTMPGGFDTNYTSAGSPDGSLGSIDIMPATAYDCRQIDGGGNVRGKLKWTPGNGSSPGTLEVYGSIYFDGNVVLPDNDKALYTGIGRIYATGTISFANGAEICVTSSCGSTWDPNTNVLVMVAGSSATSPSYAIDLAQNAKFQGAFMANGDYRQDNNVVTWASIVARNVNISNSSDTYGIPDFTPPPNLPTDGQPVVKVTPVAGTYRG